MNLRLFNLGSTATVSLQRVNLTGAKSPNGAERKAGQDGGGLISNATAPWVNYCIVAGNTPDDISGVALIGTENITSGDPLLAPLSNNGGSTFTMPPLAGAPAIHTATSSTSRFDQRGLPRNGTADIGATEADD